MTRQELQVQVKAKVVHRGQGHKDREPVTAVMTERAS